LKVIKRVNPKSELCIGTDSNYIYMIISQYTQTSNHYVVHLKSMLYTNYTSFKKKKNIHKKDYSQVKLKCVVVRNIMTIRWLLVQFGVVVLICAKVLASFYLSLFLHHQYKCQTLKTQITCQNYCEYHLNFKDPLKGSQVPQMFHGPHFVNH